MNEGNVTGGLILIIGSLLLWILREKIMKKNNTTGSGRFERVRELYLKLYSLREEKTQFDKDQNKKIREAEESLIKLIKSDPNQTEIELEEEKS